MLLPKMHHFSLVCKLLSFFFTEKKEMQKNAIPHILFLNNLFPETCRTLEALATKEYIRFMRSLFFFKSLVTSQSHSQMILLMNYSKSKTNGTVNLIIQKAFTRNIKYIFIKINPRPKE